MENCVLVTGGSGTLGQAVTKRLLKAGRNQKIVILSRDEASQAKMAQESEFRTAKVVYEIGDVKDRDCLTRIMARHRPNKVVHAAALKHVPICERQPSECVDTNVIGSRNILHASMEAGVASVVLVSTDKAAQPTNVYGLSKALMERLVGEYNGLKGMKVTATRFGNLVGSRGSVLELFLRQIRQDGRVTVTDPEMTRFFIRVSQAADTVDYALESGKPGTIIVPQMKAAALGEFVKAVIEFSGSQAKLDIVGPRAGEKKHEIIVAADEAPRTALVPEYLGMCILPGLAPKPAVTGPVSSEHAPKMGSDELLGMISEVGRKALNVA